MAAIPDMELAATVKRLSLASGTNRDCSKLRLFICCQILQSKTRPATGNDPHRGRADRCKPTTLNHLATIFILGAAGLSAGASLGPEAPLVAMSLGLSGLAVRNSQDAQVADCLSPNGCSRRRFALLLLLYSHSNHNPATTPQKEQTTKPNKRTAGSVLMRCSLGCSGLIERQCICDHPRTRVV